MSEAAPVLVEITRGGRVESHHRGSIAIARPSGEIVLAVGDVRRPVYPRSAVKAFQTIPFVETGAADAFGFGAAELALACASHSGTERHVDLATAMLGRVGCGDGDLECGAHVPLGEAAAIAFHRSGASARNAYNNCSGKHAGMLAVCRHCGDPTRGYTRLDHPHQARILTVLRAFTGEALGADVTGIDGCSAPNWAIPLTSLAGAYAQFVSGEGAAKSRRAVTERIMAAAFAEPELVAGAGRLDTLVMAALPGRVFLKTGAEGVYCGAFPESGLGFALKIDDGTGRASEFVTRAIIAAAITGAGGAFAGPNVLKNWVGTEVGEMRAGDALDRALDQLRPT